MENEDYLAFVFIRNDVFFKSTNSREASPVFQYCKHSISITFSPGKLFNNYKIGFSFDFKQLN